MKVVSTNLGERRTVKWRGKDVETGIFKKAVDRPIYLGQSDVEKDTVIDRKYHGGIDKACYIYSADHYPFWQEKYPTLEFEAGMFGENITIAGLHEASLHIGDVFRLGKAEVQISEPRQPCFKLGIRFGTQTILKDFINAPYPGAYLRIIKEGIVAAGDQMQLIEAHSDKIGLVEVYRLIYSNKKEDIKRLNELLTSTVISEDTRKNLQKRLEILSR